MKYLRFLKYLLKHKYYVFIECAKYGLYWRGITHDLSKLNPLEMIPYVNACFIDNNLNYGLDKTGYMSLKYDDNPDYFHAVAHHKRSNSHHWESWVFLTPTGELYSMPMDNDSLLEMLADWKAASLARETPYSFLRWYYLNYDKILLHEETRLKVNDFLSKEIRKCICEAWFNNPHAFEVVKELSINGIIDSKWKDFLYAK